MFHVTYLEHLVPAHDFLRYHEMFVDLKDGSLGL